MTDKEIYCCGCSQNIDARLTTGREVYPNHPRLSALPFWVCDACSNYVGCHPRSTQPLGCIPTPDVRSARSHIHALIDVAWKSGQISRSKLYSELSRQLGYQYHTANVRTIEEARTVYRTARNFLKTL